MPKETPRTPDSCPSLVTEPIVIGKYNISAPRSTLKTKLAFGLFETIYLMSSAYLTSLSAMLIILSLACSIPFSAAPPLITPPMYGCIL